jgi:hypothetical protein
VQRCCSRPELDAKPAGVQTAIMEAQQYDRTVQQEIRAALREHVERKEDIDPTGQPPL